MPVLSFYGPLFNCSDLAHQAQHDSPGVGLPPISALIGGAGNGAATLDPTSGHGPGNRQNCQE